MMSRRFLIAVVFLAAASAKGDWKVANSERHPAKSGLATRIAVSAEDSATSDTARLQLAVFDSSKVTMRVIDQPSEPRSSLAATMRECNCIAGVNGGYFDPEYAPVGLLISDGRVVLGKQKARLLSGVVSVVGGRLRIQRGGDFSPKGKPTAARQCGPFLVERGKSITGLNDTRTARRTFVLVADGGRAALGSASGVTLAQLGALLATPGLVSDLKVQSALNLDGGSSSAFWFAGEDGVFSIREQKTVRDFIGIVAKP